MGVERAEAMVWLVDGLQQVGEYAARQHVSIAFEPEPGMLIDSMTAWEELLAQSRMHDLCLTLDVGHLHCQGEGPIDEVIGRWASRLVNVHIEDMKAGVHEHLMFGEGQVDFPAVFRGLSRIGFAGGVHVELSRHSHEAPAPREKLTNSCKACSDRCREQEPEGRGDAETRVVITGGRRENSLKSQISNSSLILHPSSLILSPMSALDILFRDLRTAKRKALMPFVTAGDPDLQFTAELLRCLIARGSSLCELGIPYSDPIADGPVIQSSYTRALQHKIKLAEILDMLGRVTPELKAPVVSMVSYSIIYRQGLEAYVTAARKAGVAGAIVPDLPAEESAALAEVCRRQDFSLIQLIAPTTPARAGVADCRADQRLHLLCFSNRHYGRAERIAAGDPGQRRLAPWSDVAAHLYRFWHQPARTRADARARGRWSDRRFSDRASRGRGLDRGGAPGH